MTTKAMAVLLSTDPIDSDEGSDAMGRSMLVKPFWIVGLFLDETTWGNDLAWTPQKGMDDRKQAVF